MVAGIARKSARRRRPRGSSRRGTPAGAAPAAPRYATFDADQPPADGASKGKQAAETKPAPAPASSGSAGPFILGVLAYAWVVLPLIQGGPARVKDVWRAKFLNRGPKGQVLP